jgi:predicted  nucleic acid-binding Zn-ribbon protein
MPKNRLLLLVTIIPIAFLIIQTVLVSDELAYAADDCKKISDLDDRLECYEEEKESTTKKLSDLRKEKEDVSGKIQQLLGQLTITEGEINGVQAQISELVARLEQINANLKDKNEQLEEKIIFRNKVVRDYAKKGVLNDLEVFISLDRPAELTGFQFITFNYMFQTSLNLEARRLIQILNTEIKNFEADKAEAQDLKAELESAQSQLLAAKNQYELEKTDAEQNLNVLSEKEESYEKKLADITSKQQEILAAKSGSGTGTVGDYDSPKWKVPDAPFSPAYGFFSYGAYTHYKGMSQYGAKGRAEAGKNYEDIIKFYYGKDVTKKDDFPSKICVEGVGEMDFQKYLYGLAEMPSSWPKDALKAQAIAARTYAYRYQKEGKCICTTQRCQVFLKSKSDNPPDKWKEAVDDTKGRIISGDAHGMYSSTTGGYIESIGWDVAGKWPNDAYEKKANSPWFYWAWYTENYRFDSGTCGRSHPWLTEEETADILNAWVVWRKGSGSDRDRISPVTTSCWGGNPYSMDKMKEKAGDLGDSYSRVSGVDVDVGNNGQTIKVHFDTNKGRVSIDGAEFKTVFNLRAPGYISLRSRLYDIQKE